MVNGKGTADLNTSNVTDRVRIPVSALGPDAGELSNFEWIQLLSLLDKFSDGFPQDGDKPSRTSATEHRIDFLPETRPFKQPLRRVPLHLKEVFDKQADEMVFDGLMSLRLGNIHLRLF